MENQFINIKSWQHARKFSFKQSIEVKEKALVKNSEISFDFALTCSETIHNNLCWKIERDNFLLNGESPDSPHMQLFIGAENSIFPLSVEISPQGKLIAIDEFFAWKNKTFQKLDFLQSQFEGFYAADFIQRFKDEIQTESFLKNKLSGQAFFNLLFFNPFQNNLNEKLNWNLLKIGNQEFKGESIQNKIKDKITELNFKSINESIFLTKPEKELEEFESDLQLSHQFNPFSFQTEKKDCSILLKNKDGKFSYQENVNMNFKGLRIEKSIHSNEVKKRNFFLSEQEELKK